MTDKTSARPSPVFVKMLKDMYGLHPNDVQMDDRIVRSRNKREIEEALDEMGRDMDLDRMDRWASEGQIPLLPTDRKGLIRMASELPLGDRKRRAILSGLKAGAGSKAGASASQVAKELKEVASLASRASGETDNLPWVAVRLAAILDAMNMVLYYIDSDSLDAAVGGDLTKIAQKIRRATNNGKKLGGAGKTAKIDDEDLNKVLIVMKAHVSRRPDKGWQMMAAPEDAASGPADSGIVADWLGWGGGAATTALRVLQRQGLVNSVKGRTRKNRWYLTPKGLQAAVRAKTTTKLAQKKP